MLVEIGRELARYIKQDVGAIIVREKALDIIHHSAKTVEVLHKVVGVTDLYAWWLKQSEFEEVPVKTVKSLVANDQNAEKDQVAAALTQFVGEQQYDCDDESDAVAVGIAWLIMNKFIDSPYPDEKKVKRA